jgi:hypothetical protein
MSDTKTYHFPHQTSLAQPGLEEGVRPLCVLVKKLNTFLHMYPSGEGGLSVKSVKRKYSNLLVET